MSITKPHQQSVEQWSYVSQTLRSAYGQHAYRAVLIDYSGVDDCDRSDVDDFYPDEESNVYYYVTVYDKVGQALKPDLCSSFWSQEAFITYYQEHLIRYENFHAKITDEQRWILIAEDFCHDLFATSEFAEGEYILDSPSIIPI